MYGFLLLRLVKMIFFSLRRTNSAGRYLHTHTIQSNLYYIVWTCSSLWVLKSNLMCENVWLNCVKFARNWLQESWSNCWKLFWNSVWFFQMWFFFFKVINLHIPNKFKYLTKITTNFLSASIIKQYINFLKKKIHVVCM